jgi:excinuclease ABC subunit C
MPVSKLIKDQVSVIPEKPGVYKYYDADGRILYIGKAKSLKKRVRSYFTRGQQSAKLKILVSKIHKISYTLTDSEFDAFLLENNLIKKHQPRYNVELKDGKTYPFICIKNERFPRVFSTRQVDRDGSEYFGPYASVTAMNTVLDVIRKLFTVRSCSLNLTEENIQKGKYRVCLDYHINLCKGPCEGLQSESDYMNDIANIRKILNGNTGVVIRLLKSDMQKAAENLDFEKAQELKGKIESLEKFQARSTIVNPRIRNADVFALYTEGSKVFISYMRVVNGAIIQTFSVAYKKKLDESEKEILKLAIVDLKERFRSNSKEIIVPFSLEMDGPSGISPFRFTNPLRGDKKKLLDLCYKNAMYFAKSQLINNEQKTQKNTGLP